MDGEAIFFMGRGGAGRARPKIHGAGWGGEGVKICGAGRGRGSVYWLKSYAAAKEILICIALHLLNIRNLDRNHNKRHYHYH